MITVDRICLQAGLFRLADVSLTIPTGEYGVLMGRTGCGKTTILESVIGLRTVQSGHIRLGDEDVTK